MSVSSNYPAHDVSSGIGNPVLSAQTNPVAAVSPTVRKTFGSSANHGAGQDGFVDRRAPADSPDQRSYERRQFGSSHSDLSPDARELAVAIDQYKLDHRRRYITCEEMFMVIRQLGYSRAEG